jgi:hypothetical protein
MRAIEFLPEAGLNRQQLMKRKNLQIFMDKVKRGDSFLTTDGRQVVIDKKFFQQEDFIEQLIKGEWPPRQPMPLVGGGMISFSRLQKTPEFGGKGSEDHLQKEIKAMGSLTQQLEALKQDSPSIKLKVGGYFVNAASVVNTPGTPKSDFHILDPEGNEVAWISHKDGSPASPKKFGQWGGLSRFWWSDDADTEVARFVRRVRAKFPDGMPKGQTAVMAPISDPHLQMMAVYGYKFGKKQFGRHNVTTVLQGPPQIVSDGKAWRLTALAEWPNGSRVTGEYTPVLCARYASDRNDCGIPHTRLTFYPLLGRKFADLYYTEEE